MKKLLFAAVAALTFTASATTIEPDAQVGVTRDVAISLAELIKIYGYRCDSISGARKFLTGRGFVVNCNNYRYTYEIEDKGGRWVISVQ